LPPIGFALGTFLTARRPALRSRHGRWIILISVVAAGIWVLVFTSNVLTSTSTDTSY
jgi:hypothetical protein